jgi:hypothetical protein
MKEYSISQIIHIDSPSLISIIENFERYTKNTVVITNAELDRRNLLTTELNFKIKEFSSINNITDIKATFLSILDNQGVAMNEWLQMGREKTSVSDFVKKITEKNVQTDPILNWKEARNGIIIFCIIHFIFEIASGNFSVVGPTVFFNYLISRWYINKQIEKGKSHESFLLLGLMVSGVVFVLRTILGFIVTLLILS